MMAGDKRKGKAPQEAEAKKRKKQKKAELAAKAAEEIAARRAPGFQIREGHEGSESQREQQAPRRSERHRTQQQPTSRGGPRTRGGGTSQASRQRPTREERAEELQAVRAVYEYDTAVRVQDGVALTNYGRLTAEKVRRLQWDHLFEEWHPSRRDSRVDGRFWTLT